MRYRTLDANGDMTWGQGAANFLINSPDAVAQLVETRLLLIQGEFFLDVLDGTPYATQILGTGTKLTYDQAIRARILGTQGVLAIASYASQVINRALSVQATIDTIFGEALIQRSFALTNPANPPFAVPPPLPHRSAVGQLDYSDPDDLVYMGAL